MATKSKAKAPVRNKVKVLKKKGKASKATPRLQAKTAKLRSRTARKPAPASAAAPALTAVVPKPPSRQFAGAVAALEAGIRLMYSESYEKAIRAFNKVIADYPDEAEIQASAKARIQACEKKIQEAGRTVYRSADDHYNIAIALLNRGDLDDAIVHLQQALKLAPKSDHVLYAMAAANALQGNKDQALTYLKQSIHHRPENRFQAVQDRDFAALIDEPAFRELVMPANK
jgi:tetratricopeptide (TPR) repeat protein